MAISLYSWLKELLILIFSTQQIDSEDENWMGVYRWVQAFSKLLYIYNCTHTVFLRLEMLDQWTTETQIKDHVRPKIKD